MKCFTLLSTLIIFLVAVNACTHDWVQPLDEPTKGEWQWAYSVGGVGGDSLAPINNGLVTFSLNPDSTFIFYLNNVPQDSGSYAMHPAAANSRSVLHFDHGIRISQLSMEPEQLVIAWSSNELQLFDEGVSDGFNHHFKKVK